jgi:hypothetical protein
MRRVVLLTLSHVVVLAIGFAVAFIVVGARFEQTRAFADHMAKVAYYSNYLSIMRTQGDDRAYEDALRDYLRLLEELKATSAPYFSERIYATDKGLTLMRLARLAKKRGSSSEASSLASEAEALCPVIGLRECSAGAIDGMVSQLDSKARGF